MGTSLTARVQGIDRLVTDREEKFASLLPSGIPFERFKTTLLTAVANNPQLLDCTADTLILGAIKAAEDGLLLDGREAALVPFAGKAQYVQMVAGLRKLAWGSSLQAVVQTHLVYEGERVIIQKGSSGQIVHESTLESLDQGIDAVIGCYAIATLPDGRQLFEIMGRATIAKFRGASKNQRADSPWRTWPEQMIRTRPAKRVLKALPLQSNSDADRRLVLAANRFEPDIEGIAEEADAPAVPAIAHEAHLEQVLGLTPTVSSVARDALANLHQEVAAIHADEPTAEEAAEALGLNAPAEPPKRKRGRPPGAPNKPKPPAEPPPPAPPPLEEFEPGDGDGEAEQLHAGVVELVGAVRSYGAACALEAELQPTLERLAEIDHGLHDAACRTLGACMDNFRPRRPEPPEGPEWISPDDARNFAEFIRGKLKPHPGLTAAGVVDRIRRAPKNAATLGRVQAAQPEIFAQIEQALENFAAAV